MKSFRFQLFLFHRWGRSFWIWPREVGQHWKSGLRRNQLDLDRRSNEISSQISWISRASNQQWSVRKSLIFFLSVLFSNICHFLKSFWDTQYVTYKISKNAEIAIAQHAIGWHKTSARHKKCVKSDNWLKNLSSCLFVLVWHTGINWKSQFFPEEMVNIYWLFIGLT